MTRNKIRRNNNNKSKQKREMRNSKDKKVCPNEFYD
jgi:hypothetical protein